MLLEVIPVTSVLHQAGLGQNPPLVVGVFSILGEHMCLYTPPRKGYVIALQICLPAKTVSLSLTLHRALGDAFLRAASGLDCDASVFKTHAGSPLLQGQVHIP